MPITGPLASLPKIFNPALTPLSGWVPPLALLHHRGRRSGKSYATPVQAFRTGDGWIVALVYTRNADWALNLLAAGTGEMTRAGKRTAVSNVRRTGVEGRERVPVWASGAMSLLDIEDFIEFQTSPLPDPR